MFANTKPYTAMTTEELKSVLAAEQAKLDKWSEMNLTLDLTRGKPNQAQLDLSSELLNIVSDRGDCFSASGLDCRNYGILDGLPETSSEFPQNASLFSATPLSTSCTTPWYVQCSSVLQAVMNPGPDRDVSSSSAPLPDTTVTSPSAVLSVSK